MPISVRKGKTCVLKYLIVLMLFSSMLVHCPISAETGGGIEQLVYEDNFDAYDSRSEMPTSSSLPVRWQFSAPTNTAVTLESHPTDTEVNPALYESGEASLTLDPYSVTVIVLEPAAE